jgi:hypothetical protein
VGALTGRLVRHGLRRGILDGSRPWLVVGLVVWLARLARRLASPEPETVWSGSLRPGETLVVSNSPPEP